MKNKTSEIPFKCRWQCYLLPSTPVTARLLEFTQREYIFSASDSWRGNHTGGNSFSEMAKEDLLSFRSNCNWKGRTPIIMAK
jgi:hypothetical protein